MRSLILLLGMFFCSSSVLFAQTATEAKVLENMEMTNQAIFGKRDSALLVKLFSPKLSYGHSGGKIEGKNAAIENAMSSQTTYKKLETSNVTIDMDGKTAVVRYIFSAIQNIKGEESLLKLGIVQVWVKHKKDWQLITRQAVKVK